MAGVEGFEPSNGGIKSRCLTAWLHPNKLAFIIYPQLNLHISYSRLIMKYRIKQF